MVGCTSDAEVLKGVLDSLDSHEFVFTRLMAFADALSCMWSLSSLLSVISPDFQSGADWSFPPSRFTPKAGADGGIQKTQIHRAATPSQPRKQLMTLLLIPHHRLRQGSIIRYEPEQQERAFLSPTSMRNSRRYMPRSLLERLFSCFPDTVTRAACLRSLHGGRSIRRVRTRTRTR